MLHEGSLESLRTCGTVSHVDQSELNVRYVDMATAFPDISSDPILTRGWLQVRTTIVGIAPWSISRL